MGLWYPGRPPFCSDEVIWLLTQFVDTLHELTAAQDATRLQVLEAIAEDALSEIEAESAECNGTDRVLNTLRTLFNDAFKGAVLAYQNQAWDSIFEIATNMLVIRDELREEHEKVLRQQEVTQ
jgi:hypothetical protein